MKIGQFSLNELMALRVIIPKYLNRESLTEGQNAVMNKAFHGSKSDERARKILEFVNREISRITGAPMCEGCGEGFE